MNKKVMKLIRTIFSGLLLGWACAANAADPKPLYENNFEKAEPDKVPADLLVLDGGFEVKADAGNKFIELPGAPLGEGSGLLLGPSEKDGVAVTARIHATGKGRRFPTFAVGLNGAGGFRLQVTPAKKLLEIFKGDEVVARAPFTWESDSWTLLRLQARKVKAGEWKIEGKAWKQGGTEPKEWLVTFTSSEETAAGRASIWGSPVSGTPIRFDDLAVTKVEK